MIRINTREAHLEYDPKVVPVTVIMDAEARIIRVKYTEPYTFEEWLEGAAAFRNDRIAPFDKQFGFLIDRTYGFDQVLTDRLLPRRAG